MRSIALIRKPLWLFPLVVGLIVLIGQLLLGSSAYRSHDALFQLAITVDLALFIPFLYYLFIRRGAAPLITLVPVFIACVVLASSVLPRDGQRFVEWVKFSFVPLELFASGYLIWTVRRSIAAFKDHEGAVPGFIEQLNTALRSVLGRPGLAAIAATEIGVIHYGLFGWRAKKETGDRRAFTYHLRSSYSPILNVFYFLITLETMCLHLLIARWSGTAAWVLTALSIYGLLFLFADRNAILRRPILLDGLTLYVRIGMRWRVEIPLMAIVSARAIGANEKPVPGCAQLLLLGTANIALDLDREVTANGLYGIRRKFSQLRLAVDDREAFIKAVEEARRGA